MRLLLRIALALPFLALGSCARNISPPGVFFSSEPPGARILVDGLDSGYVTPRLIALDDEERYRIRLELPGFESQQVILVPHSVSYWIAWEEGAVGMYGLRFPLFLAVGEMIVPRRINTVHSPSRIYVRMQPRQDS
jgi:hypothetical protein